MRLVLPDGINGLSTVTAAQLAKGYRKSGNCSKFRFALSACFAFFCGKSAVEIKGYRVAKKIRFRISSSASSGLETVAAISALSSFP